MLEIRNVTKTYRSKSGTEVRALDDVSITFPETGMVFVLGKSGSGKSTLLNVIGGLDGCDTGEFIIKGKSSREFGGSDFDAYRNTFVGFIFQEYNILDDFTVGANIGLALELQGKKADSAKISEILAEVDLLDYGKRKPNELSGGQKQRIAIARALVKDPEIIMADEPTGALDSTTGKQIFDTLKELSKKKLVIVVSHDRDFAERYADRIIEMQDGRIFSDVTRHEVAAKPLSDGILQINEHLLRIERGYQLTASDVERINAYLRTHDTELLVSGDPHLNNSVRATAGISENNTSAVFESTDEAKDVRRREYHAKDTRFIRSRLPMKNALKMGGSSLGHKKFRLVITILLSVIAFTMFGFADTMGAYNKHKAATQSILDSHVDAASFSLGVQYTYSYPDGDSYSYYRNTSLNEDDIKLLNEKFGMDFIPVYNGSTYPDSTISLSSMMKTQTFISGAYTAKLYGMISPSESQIRALNFTVTGSLPKNEDEIAISRLVYEQFKTNGFINYEKNESVNAEDLTCSTDEKDTNSIIGKHLTFSLMGSQATYRITGVIDTRFDYERYSQFLPSDDNSNPENEMGLVDMVMQQELESTLHYGFHALGFLTPEGIDTLAQNFYFQSDSMIGTSMNWSFNMHIPTEDGDRSMYINRVADSSVLSGMNVTWLDGKERTKLGQNEIVVSAETVNNFSFRASLRDKLLEKLKAAAGDLWIEEFEDREPSELLYDISLRRAIALHYDEYEADVRELFGMQYASDQEIYDQWYYNYDYIAIELQLPSLSEIEKQISIPIIEELLNIELSDAYDIYFYRNIFYSLNDIYPGSLASVLSSVYAHELVYAGGADLYNSDKFVNKVLLIYYSDLEYWNSIKNEDERLMVAAEAFSHYLRFHYDKNEFGNKTENDFDSEGRALFFSVADIDLSELYKDVYFSSQSYWNGNEETKEYRNLTVVGLFQEAEWDLIISDTICEIYEEYRVEANIPKEEMYPHESGIYAFAIAPMPKDAESISALVAFSYDETGGLHFEMKNQVMNSLDLFNEFIEIFAKVFLWVGVGFAVFSALMLMNFISISISYKRREIGILRAVGARSSDVFRIFFSEAFLIAAINCVLSIGATVAAVIILNHLVRNEGINVTLLNFGARQVILMALISVFVAAAASFLPVWKIARKKPVDAIKNK